MNRPHRAGSRPALLALAAVFVLGAFAAAFLGGTRHADAAVCTKSWAAAASGSWDVGANWSGGTVPAGGDDVCIDVAGTYTVTLNGGHSVHSVTVGHATTGTQTLSIEGTGVINTTFSIGAASATTTHGVITLTSTGGGYSQLQLAGNTLTNAGTLQVLPGAGGSRFLDGGPLVNSGSVVVSAALSSNGSLAVTNTGNVTANAAWTISG